MKIIDQTLERQQLTMYQTPTTWLLPLHALLCHCQVYLGGIGRPYSHSLVAGATQEPLLQSPQGL